MRYENSDMIPIEWDIITIIFPTDDFDLELTALRYYRLDEPGDMWLFGNAMQIANNRGFNDSVITMICENPLEGKIYQYGNYGDRLWYEHGTTKGYA